MPVPAYCSFTCPACGWTCEIRWIPETRIDPGYLDGDPPEECPECGADMTDAESEPAEPPAPDPDSLHDRGR